MSKKPLCVAILWHMHQPDYGNIQTGEICLPWTRLHAVKDYYDMGALAAEVPGLHLTINLVPSLMDQLRSYARGTARETYVQLTLRDAADLDLREKSFLLRSFFQLPWKQMVLPYPRFKNLLERRGTADERGDYSTGLKRYAVQDFRDLQVWFNLCWCGPELRRRPEIAALFAKGSDFTEAEKSGLLDSQRRFIAEILPLYSRLSCEHGIEISVSPYYHPIIPLLCDNRSAREALPDIPLPANPFLFPADAREQVRRAQQRYLEEFGRTPTGMWPSEGSISDATAAIAREAGLLWLASDEGVLLNSLTEEGRVTNHLTAEQKFCAYRWGDGEQGPCFFFRDHGLSDLIGFTYSRWESRDAAADFLRRLRGIYDCLPDDNRHYVVAVILDGENAWEHYPENGIPFLRALYRGLVEDEHLRTVTLSEFLELESHREPLKSIAAGSWIYGNLATWIGHSEKNRAWDLVTAARRFLNSRQRVQGEHPRLQEAYKEMLIAQGSDWFWWYGDDHHSQNAAEFDSLFRGHVKNVYRLLDESYPMELDIPIKRADAKTQYRNPVHTISPRLDGRVTDYFEWLAAGFAHCSGGAGSMHRTETLLDKIFFGYDALRFYLRVDVAGDLREALPPGASLQVQFVEPRECRLKLARDDKENWKCIWIGSGAPAVPPAYGADRILEIGIPLETLDVRKTATIRFSIAVTKKDREMERYPANDFLEVPVDPWGLDQQEWIV